jgi:hypothetical protein
VLPTSVQIQTCFTPKKSSFISVPVQLFLLEISIIQGKSMKNSILHNSFWSGHSHMMLSSFNYSRIYFQMMVSKLYYLLHRMALISQGGNKIVCKFIQSHHSTFVRVLWGGGCWLIFNYKKDRDSDVSPLIPGTQIWQVAKFCTHSYISPWA